MIFLSYQWREVSEPIGCVKNKSQPWIMSPDTGIAWNLQTEGLNIPKTLAEIIDKESVRKRYKVQTNLYCTMYYRKISGPDKSYEKQLMSLTNTEVLLKCLYCDKEGNSVATCLLPQPILQIYRQDTVPHVSVTQNPKVSWHELGEFITNWVQLADEKLKSRGIQRYRRHKGEKDGWRLVQDLQAVNGAVLPRAPVVPDMHVLLNELYPENEVFSVIDNSNPSFPFPYTKTVSSGLHLCTRKKKKEVHIH